MMCVINAVTHIMIASCIRIPFLLLLIVASIVIIIDNIRKTK